MPRDPVKTTTLTYVEKIGGKITLNGIMLNGVDLDMDSAFCYNPLICTRPPHICLGSKSSKCGLQADWYAVPAANPESVVLDEYTGHSYNGRYHYHGDNEALSFLDFNELRNIYGSPVIDFTPDGFPIYEHYFYDESSCNVRKATSS